MKLNIKLENSLNNDQMDKLNIMTEHLMKNRVSVELTIDEQQAPCFKNDLACLSTERYQVVCV